MSIWSAIYASGVPFTRLECHLRVWRFTVERSVWSAIYASGDYRRTERPTRRTEVCTVARRPREPVDGTVMATGGSPLRSGITPCPGVGRPGRVHSAVHRRAQPPPPPPVERKCVPSPVAPGSLLMGPSRSPRVTLKERDNPLPGQGSPWQGPLGGAQAGSTPFRHQRRTQNIPCRVHSCWLQHPLATTPRHSPNV